MTTIAMPQKIADLMTVLQQEAPALAHPAAALGEARKVKVAHAALDRRATKKYRDELKAERATLVKAVRAELAKAKKLSDLNPTAQSLYGVGSLYQQLGDDTAAKEFFKKAIKLDDKHADAHNDLGLSLLRDPKINSTKIGAALEHLKKAQQLSPDLPRTNISVAEELRSLVKIREAKVGPVDYNLMGVEYLKLNEFDAAKDCFRKAIAADADNAEAHNNLAFCYLYGDLDIEKGLASAVKAHELNPGLPTHQLTLATLLAKHSLEPDE
jgi:tetratricopeptide (TPR) repeat protein